ncbi:MAG TPA: hypothetical protein VE997_06145 [Candidatus Limnocylindria bacterium]|jgi:hypothetical protein|nr:hypothetical protein [Candidatus Limnocylindria bacterium]
MAIAAAALTIAYTPSTTRARVAPCPSKRRRCDRGDARPGRQVLADGSPEAGQKLGRRAAARGGIADDDEDDQPDRRAGDAEQHLEGGDRQREREDEEGRDARDGEELAGERADDDVPRERRQEAGADREGDQRGEADRERPMPGTP